MKLYQGLCYSTPTPCPYLPDQSLTQAYFFAEALDAHELDLLLSTGWRKFGHLFFRPACKTCRKCIPIRIPVRDFIPSKSQRRLIRKNHKTIVQMAPLEYSTELYEIYRDHCKTRFDRDVKQEEFQDRLCTVSCPSILSKYYTNGTFSGAGFLDRSSTALSSVYFVFRTGTERYALGNYSVLSEIQYACDEGLLYYYLGYYVEVCSVMEYKSHFYPHERYDWIRRQWVTVEKL